MGKPDTDRADTDTEDDGARFAAALQQAGALFMAGRYEAALESASVLYADVHGDPPRQVQVALLASKVCWNAKWPEEGIHWAGQAIDNAALIGDAASDAEGWALKGACHALAEQAELAVQCLDRAIGLLSPEIRIEIQRTVLTAVGLSYQYLGLSAPALGPMRRAYEIAASTGVEQSLLRCGVNLAYAIVEAMDMVADGPEAERDALCREAMALVEVIDRRLPDQPSDQTFYATRDATARVLLACGDLSGARGRLQACLDRGTERRPVHLLSWYIDLAYADLMLGNRDAAGDGAHRARVLIDAENMVPRNAIELRRMARLAVVEGDAVQAMDWMRRFHARVVRNEHAMLEARVAEFNAAETAQTLQLEVADLRQQREGLAVQFQALQQMARTDALTGLLNRRGLESEFNVLRARGLHLLMIDLDHFKRINDQFGHAVGDAVLRQFGQLMTENFRGLDRAARYGGEELAALLVAAGEEGARQAIDRLRLRVAEFGWTGIHPELAVTFSGGIVAVAPQESFEEAIARADAALYRAKSAGRDRVFSETECGEAA